MVSNLVHAVRLSIHLQLRYILHYTLPRCYPSSVYCLSVLTYVYCVNTFPEKHDLPGIHKRQTLLHETQPERDVKPIIVMYCMCMYFVVTFPVMHYSILTKNKTMHIILTTNSKNVKQYGRATLHATLCNM